ncbi:protein-glutamate O-methyltransferase CheR [Oxalobacteraceae bacterium]|nr:protein-glutamate O-methyltransferase CheR [Oxalobacteraceae bacterium]
MSAVQTLLREATGLNLSKAVVERAIQSRLEQTGASDSDAYLAALTPEELGELTELVVVPESWLFRDAQAFQAAVEYVRQCLGSHPARVLHILCIPCAGGEEPYSMAMALFDAGVASKSFTIDAVDISAACVARARSGIYGRNAFRAQDLQFRERYFHLVDGDDYQIDDRVRKQVRFRQGNLLEFDAGGRKGNYDVIFCRNLLIYFDKPTTQRAVEHLHALLDDHGQLFAGYAEVPSFCHYGFTPLQYPQAFGLCKDAAAPAVGGVRAKAAAERAAANAPAPRAARASKASATPLAKGAAPRDAGATPGRRGAAPAAATAKVPAAAQASANAPPGEEVLRQARQLADLGRFQEADAKCQQWLAAVPDSAEAYFILGLLNEHAGKMTLAEDYWKRCIYLQPEHYEALCHLALLAEQNNDTAGAARLKARAARIYQRQQAN